MRRYEVSFVSSEYKCIVFSQFRIEPLFLHTYNLQAALVIKWSNFIQNIDNIYCVFWSWGWDIGRLWRILSLIFVVHLLLAISCYDASHENKSRLDWFIWHLMPRGHAKVLGKAIPFISRKICDGTCATQRFDNFSFIEIPYYYVQTLFMWKNILHFVVC